MNIQNYNYEHTKTLKCKETGEIVQAGILYDLKGKVFHYDAFHEKFKYTGAGTYEKYYEEIIN